MFERRKELKATHQQVPRQPPFGGRRTPGRPLQGASRTQAVRRFLINKNIGLYMDKSSCKSNFVNVNSIRLHYLDWGGNGPVLLFLPGLGCNAYIFDQFAPRFTDKFHVLGLTRRGHGDSDYPETGYDIDTLTEDIRQFMDYLKIDQAILAGHSMAGIELSHFAALYPERVLKLIFLDAAYDRSSPEYKAIQENNPMKGISIPGENDDYYNVQDYVDFIKRTYIRLGEIWGDLMDEHILPKIKKDENGKVIDKMSDAISKSFNETMTNYVPDDAKILAPTLNIYVIREIATLCPQLTCLNSSKHNKSNFLIHSSVPGKDTVLNNFIVMYHTQK